MSIEGLQKLCDARRWFDCSEKIVEMAAGPLSGDEAAAVARILDAAILRMHPSSSSATVAALVPHLPLGDAVGLLSRTHAAISSQGMTDDSYMNELASVGMQICLCKIKSGEAEDRETEILGWKKIYEQGGDVARPGLSPENYRLLQYVAYHFYALISNVEEAQAYLFSYTALSGDAGLLERLVKLSIVSKTFFDFSSVIELDGFDGLSDQGLADLLVAFQRGDFAQIEKKKRQVAAVVEEIAGPDLAQEYMGHVAEKVYLVSILNICFEAEHKCVPLDRFVTELRIDESHLVALLLRALGIGLISGWVDSRERMLFYDRVAPRSLCEEDISRMRNRFVLWRDRVARAIASIEGI